MKFPSFSQWRANDPGRVNESGGSSNLIELAQSWEQSGWQVDRQPSESGRLQFTAIFATRNQAGCKQVSVDFLVELTDSNLVQIIGLGQVIPRTLIDRAKVRIVAIESGLSRRGYQRFLSDLGQGHFRKDGTLILGLASAGFGPLILDCCHERLADLARQAADDLWIPHQFRQRQPWRDRIFGKIRDRDARRITLSGTPGVANYDLAIACAGVQLAMEIALRWSRPAQGDGVSLARSSQKPG